MTHDLNSINYLNSKNIHYKIVEVARQPLSASDVVKLYGCPLDQVIKTLLFVGNHNVIACLPGDKKVDMRKIKQIVNANNLRLANANEVQKVTGFQIGGVCPFCIKSDAEIFYLLDESILKKPLINIGSGRAEIGIEMSPQDLKKIFPGKVVHIVM